ncbi:hypothetical protein [Knoellia sp. Soil729]|uniref:hypothetical protein n=1 Tax=Knoellia sp. Soil729 TaxID=1736394 RepID=UPI0006F46228|nr:hypothetical protein [Knoellia sp. Soil729]KRE40262.1 hypothetical protein ASG74_16625 [Knoellia sp. Soil729]
MSLDKECAICGAAVRNMELHADFHTSLDEVQRVADEAADDASAALDKAEHSANILYQRNLD